MTLFKGYNQFINWIPHPKSNGKTDKIPVDVSGKKIDPHLPGVWMSEEDAKGVEALTGYRTGFVFTEDDPFFFVDVDENPDSTLSKTIASAFPGCGMEISQSGKGLHIFGTGNINGYKTRSDRSNLELYTHKRFAALTGTDFQGDTATNGQAGLNWYAREFFSEKLGTTNVSWTTEPCENWNGYIDDAELIRRAKKSRSAAVTFGSKASFAELFDGVEELSKFYPSGSEMDAALCSHFAFWTGKNCERMERLFNASELGKRDKWMNREDYREQTILNAVGLCQDVHARRDPVGKTTEKIRTGSQFMDLAVQLEHFRGCVYIVSRHRVFVPAMGLLKPEQFRAVFGGYDFAMKSEGKSSRNAFEVFTESQLYDFPEAFGTCFQPEKPSGKIIAMEGVKYVNTYDKPDVPRMPGDVSRFTELLRKLLPEERDRLILLSYMAACVQYPGEKFQWAPLLQGLEGNGKTFLFSTIARSVGEKYSHFPDAGDIGSKFNDWIYEKLFIGVEEVFLTGKMDSSEKLKTMITNPRLGMQGKGTSQFTGDNRANFMLASNFKDSVQKHSGDRRYCIFYTAQQKPGDLKKSGMAGNYFPKLYTWAREDGYAIITNYLIEFKIPEEFNPATDCHRAPKTTSTAEALELSLTGPEQEIIEAVREGRPGFRGGWISSIALDSLLTEKRQRIAINKRKSVLVGLGYEIKCRLNNGTIQDHGRRPTLYIESASRELRKINPGIDTQTAYLKAQAPSSTPEV